MQCCAARKVQMALRLNGLQAFKLHKYLYSTILETYLRPYVLSRVEMKGMFCNKHISTTIQYSKASLIDFGTENKNNDKKYNEIPKGNKKLDNFVESLSKSRNYRHRRKKTHQERRNLPNVLPSSPSIPIDLKEPISKTIDKEIPNKNKTNGPFTTVGREELKNEKDMQVNTHMSLENIEITEKLNEKNNNESYGNKLRKSSKLQPLNYSTQKNISKYEKYVHNSVCIICTSVLQEFLDNNQQEFAFSSLKEYQKQNKTPAFPILVSLANWGGHNGRPDVVKTTEVMARKYFTSLFMKNLNFENHLAIAHMKIGEVTESFLVLEKFLCSYYHTTYPKISKKKKDTLTLIMNFLPTEEKSIIEEAEVFINKIVEKNERVSYALPLWKVCFISKNYYCQQVADRLLVQHPSLVFMIGQKVRSIVGMSVEAEDQELLYRLLQLLLRHDLQQHLILPTAGILKIQCKSADLAMAHETLLFAKRMNIRLDPHLVQHFYKVLQEYRQRPRIFPRTRIFPRPAPKELPKRFTPPSLPYKF